LERIAPLSTIWGNCYAVDCNGKIKSTEIPSSVLFEADVSLGYTIATPIFQIGCICRGKMALYQSLGTIATYERLNSGTPAPANLDAFYRLCTACGPAPEELMTF